VTILLFLLAWTRFGLTLEWFRAVVLLSALVVVTGIDLDHRIIPDRITLSGIPVGLFLAWLLPPGIVSSVVGTVIGGGIFYLVALLSRGGMGGGDIKLAAMLGAFLGWSTALLALFLGVLAGGVVGVVLLLLGVRGRKDPIPFGPFLALGGAVALLWGQPILAWYLRL
ncbi:MAG TPA: A24 family peptidase, partial [Candidatus Methylomirabilis sp.]|nr:A24 family peptidase [Candidatus Methylomirabilis sp.]